MFVAARSRQRISTVCNKSIEYSGLQGVAGMWPQDGGTLIRGTYVPMYILYFTLPKYLRISKLPRFPASDTLPFNLQP